MQALRGTYPFVRKMSALDHEHSAEHLAESVFRTFPGLYHMLPAPKWVTGMDLYDPRCWPSDGPAPDAALLGRAAAARACLAPADSRMIHVVGVNQETVVGLRRTAGRFEYTMDRNGDGTVPLALAKLPGLKSYFVDESHANLPNNPRVIQAIIDLARPRAHGRTARSVARQAGRHSPHRRCAAADGGERENRLAAPHAAAARSGVRGIGQRPSTARRGTPPGVAAPLPRAQAAPSVPAAAAYCCGKS